MKDGSFNKTRPDRLDSIIMEQLKEHGGQGYLELEKKVKEAQKRLNQRQSSHMTINNHLKKLVEFGRVGHDDAGKGRKGEYYLVEYDARLEAAENHMKNYLDMSETRLELVKKNFDKFSSDEKCNSLLYITSAIFFQRWQIGLARQYIHEPNYMASAVSRFERMDIAISKFAGRLQDPDVILQIDVMLAQEVKRLMTLLDEILAPKEQG